MYKTICVFLTAILLSFSSLSSPALKERGEFCQLLASNAAQAAAAKALGWETAQFEQALMEYALVNIAQQNMTPSQLEEMILAMKEAFSQGRPTAQAGEAAFKACMQRKEV